MERCGIWLLINLWRSSASCGQLFYIVAKAGTLRFAGLERVLQKVICWAVFQLTVQHTLPSDLAECFSMQMEWAWYPCVITVLICYVKIPFSLVKLVIRTLCVFWVKKTKVIEKWSGLRKTRVRSEEQRDLQVWRLLWILQWKFYLSKKLEVQSFVTVALWNGCVFLQKMFWCFFFGFQVEAPFLTLDLGFFASVKECCTFLSHKIYEWKWRKMVFKFESTMMAKNLWHTYKQLKFLLVQWDADLFFFNRLLLVRVSNFLLLLYYFLNWNAPFFTGSSFSFILSTQKWLYSWAADSDLFIYVNFASFYIAKQTFQVVPSSFPNLFSIQIMFV